MKFVKIVVTLTPHLGPSLNFACLAVNIVDHYNTGAVAVLMNRDV